MPLPRPAPLVLLAAATLVFVLGLGGVLLVWRPGGRHGAPLADVAPPSEAPAVNGPVAPPAPAREPAAAVAGAAIVDAGAAPEELPVWARPPRTTAQPFPEAAREDLPHPPYKVPSWMLGSDAPPASVSDGGD